MSASLRAFSLDAHAKVNLRLEVGPRAGSHHLILSVVAELELADEVHFEPWHGGFEVVCEGERIAERDNLAWRAAHALCPRPPGVRVRIEKQIPAQAGLGGGSADAAATLIGLCSILADSETPVTHDRMLQAAAQTGSDVPGFLSSGLRVVSGTGDVVERRLGPAPLWGIVLLRPAAGSSTSDAYAALDTAGVPHELGAPARAAADEMCDAFAGADFARFVAALHNDFSTTIERTIPAVALARQRLEQAGAQATILCGSGSCVAGFFADRAAAHGARERLTLDDGEWALATGFSSD